MPENYVDCAIARILNPFIIISKVKYLGALQGVAEPKATDDVWKVGMSSGLTKGFITTLGLTLNVGSGKKQFFIKAK